MEIGKEKIVIYHIGVSEPVEPATSLFERKGVLVVLEGMAPICRYCMSLHKLYKSPVIAVIV